MKEFEPVRTVHCKNCGFPMRQYNPESLMLVCESCGTRTGESRPPPYKPELPNNPLFKLQTAFELEGATWQVIGCQSYAGFTEEWDKEDNSWEKTPWNYHTWWVINEARELAWIVQDKTGYSWSRKAKITSGIPEGDISYEVGHWSLLSAVGEFSYRPAENEQVVTYEKNHRSLEILLDEHGNNKEIEAFEAVKIEPVDLLKGFGKTDVLDAMNRAKLGMYGAIASIVCLLMGFFGLQLFQQTLFDIPQTTITQQTLKQPVKLGTFAVSSKAPVAFSLEASPQKNNRAFYRDGSLDVNLHIRDSDNTEMMQVPVSLWRESGRDSDGPWTESQTRDTKRLVLPAGEQYRLSLVTEALKSWSDITVKGTVTKNSVSLLPVILGIVAAILLTFFISRMRRKLIRKATGI